MTAADHSCILLFARSTGADARRKALRGAEAVFGLAAERVRSAARDLGVDLVVVGHRLPGADAVLPQRGDSFGARLSAAFEDTRRLGYRHVVAVGNDTPCLDVATIRSAFAALTDHAMVLGPSDDGGVYLIGASRPLEGRFLEVRWCTRETRRDLLALDPDACLLHALPDVDGWSDLARLVAPGDPILTRIIRNVSAAPRIAEVVRLRHSRMARAHHPIRGPPA